MISTAVEKISQDLRASDFFDNPVLNLKVLKRDPEIDYPLHHHDFYELVYVIKGTGTHFTRTEEQSLRRGDILCITPGFYHGYKGCSSLALYNLLIGRNFIEALNDDIKKMQGFSELFNTPWNSYGRMHLHPAQRAEVEPLIERIKTESENHSATHGSKTMATANFWYFMVLICRFIENTALAAPQTLERIQTVLDYIDKTLDRAVSNEELMDIANMSASTLNRYFKQSVGLAPVEYQIQQRINQACNLILATTDTMEEIAEKTGFTDANYFSRQFKKVMNMTPSEYKKRWNVKGMLS